MPIFHAKRQIFNRARNFISSPTLQYPEYLKIPDKNTPSNTFLSGTVPSGYFQMPVIILERDKQK